MPLNVTQIRRFGQLDCFLPNHVQNLLCVMLLVHVHISIATYTHLRVPTLCQADPVSVDVAALPKPATSAARPPAEALQMVPWTGRTSSSLVLGPHFPVIFSDCPLLLSSGFCVKYVLSFLQETFKSTFFESADGFLGLACDNARDHVRRVLSRRRELPLLHCYGRPLDRPSGPVEPGGRLWASRQKTPRSRSPSRMTRRRG